MKLIALILSFLMLNPTAYAHSCPSDMVHLDTAHICYGFEFTDGPYINSRGQRKLSSGIVTLISYEHDFDLSQASFYVWMKMPTMQHGGRPLTVTPLGEGRFQVENMLLVRMPGQWFLRVNLDGLRNDHQPETDYDGELPLTSVLP
jgi:hypothetical protein